jgi:hypothetical protein
MGLSLQHLRYADEGEDMNILKRIVTVDESWVHHYQPELKHASMQWKHSSSPSTKKLEVLRLLHQLGRLCLHCFGILREYC